MPPLFPIGVVRSRKQAGGNYDPLHCPAEIEIKKELVPALKRLTENSHIWVICLYTPRKNNQLQSVPSHIDPHLDSFGILALRTPNHPNPIALTLTKLNKVVDNIVYVDELDAYDGTAVLDIKPYYEHDIVFSPTMPLIRHEDQTKRQETLWRLALHHHQESCVGAALAVKMVLVLENMGWNLQAPSVLLSVKGDACLADTLQGLCRARLANPARFAYQQATQSRCCWQYREQMVTITVQNPISKDPQEVLTAPIEGLFTLTVSSCKP